MKIPAHPKPGPFPMYLTAGEDRRLGHVYREAGIEVRIVGLVPTAKEGSPLGRLKGTKGTLKGRKSRGK